MKAPRLLASVLASAVVVAFGAPLIAAPALSTKIKVGPTVLLGARTKTGGWRAHPGRAGRPG